MIFLGSRLLTNSPPQPERMSVAFFCRECGEVWARVPGGAHGWYAVGSNCQRCWNPAVIPGSFFGDLDWEDQERAMRRWPELAKWEFGCALKWAERMNDE